MEGELVVIFLYQKLKEILTRYCKLSSQTNNFFVINVNVIFNLKLRPHAGQSDQHEA